MKAQSLEIEQLQRDLERAHSANETMRDELEQLRGEAPGTAPPVGSTASLEHHRSSSGESVDRLSKRRGHG